jgi:hypothetical protein
VSGEQFAGVCFFILSWFFPSNMPIYRDFLTAWRLALKARFPWIAAGVLLVVVLAMLLSAYFGGRQPVTVALDVGFSTIRLLLPLLLVLLAQELLSREFDKRYYLSSLTYPRSSSGSSKRMVEMPTSSATVTGWRPPK